MHENKYENENICENKRNKPIKRKADKSSKTNERTKTTTTLRKKIPTNTERFIEALRGLRN